MRVRRDGYCDVDPRLAAALSSQLLPSADAAGGRGYRAATWVVNCTTVCGDVIVRTRSASRPGATCPGFSLCVQFFLRVFTQPTCKSKFFCVFDYFPVSLSITDKET